jgi:hypothetical protein
VSIVQPGAVGTNGATGAKSFFKDDDPYLPLYQQLGVLRGEVVTPEEVAAVVADTIEQPGPPLLVPAGAPAEQALRARKEAPENVPVHAGRTRLVAADGPSAVPINGADPAP